MTGPCPPGRRCAESQAAEAFAADCRHLAHPPAPGLLWDGAGGSRTRCGRIERLVIDYTQGRAASAHGR